MQIADQQREVLFDFAVDRIAVVLLQKMNTIADRSFTFNVTKSVQRKFLFIRYTKKVTVSKNFAGWAAPKKLTRAGAPVYLLEDGTFAAKQTWTCSTYGGRIIDSGSYWERILIENMDLRELKKFAASFM